MHLKRCIYFNYDKKCLDDKSYHFIARLLFFKSLKYNLLSIFSLTIYN